MNNAARYGTGKMKTVELNVRTVVSFLTMFANNYVTVSVVADGNLCHRTLPIKIMNPRECSGLSGRVRLLIYGVTVF